MPRIQSIGTAAPPYVIAQPDLQQHVRAHFEPAFPNIDQYLPIFQHAQIDTRCLVRPLDWWSEPRSFSTCNQVFIEEGLALGSQAIARCLEPTGLTPADIDHLLVVTTTGLAAPSLDALLINELGMGRHTRRTPIWGLRCAGWIAGLARANEYVRAMPTHRALLVNIEFCSLTFLTADLSKRNLIATSLFADGVSAVLIEGDQAPRQTSRVSAPQPTILATLSTLYPDTPEIMGWRVIDAGFEVVFSSRIPGIVRNEFPALLHTFLGQHGLRQDDISRFLLHPGGAKVIAAYKEGLGLKEADLAATRSILRQYGNMSSSTIFFVVQESLREQPLAEGEYGVMAVFGPGFSAELALIRG